MPVHNWTRVKPGIFHHYSLNRTIAFTCRARPPTSGPSPRCPGGGGGFWRGTDSLMDHTCHVNAYSRQLSESELGSSCTASTSVGHGRKSERYSSISSNSRACGQSTICWTSAAVRSAAASTSPATLRNPTTTASTSTLRCWKAGGANCATRAWSTSGLNWP